MIQLSAWSKPFSIPTKTRPSLVINLAFCPMMLSKGCFSVFCSYWLSIYIKWIYWIVSSKNNCDHWHSTRADSFIFFCRTSKICFLSWTPNFKHKLSRRIYSFLYWAFYFTYFYLFSFFTLLIFFNYFWIYFSFSYLTFINYLWSYYSLFFF